MPWPSVADFTNAVQTPTMCFDDQELAQGTVVLNPRGMPLVYSGNFASVYSVECENRKLAVRCFTRGITDQRERYQSLSAYLKQTLPLYMVDFEYHSKGIRVEGEWYPIVTMEWVNGDPLDRYVQKHLQSQAELNRVIPRWRGAASDLLSRNIAHNDLQHGNIMVMADQTIRLVDYDGVFLPEFQGQSSPETGHPDFQHPKRTEEHYGTYVDNFPALVIHVSLLALAADPGLWDRFNNEKNLIFTKSDYTDPANSECFRALKNSPESDVRSLAIYLEEMCSRPVEEVPDLESILKDNLTVSPPPQQQQPSAPPPPPPSDPPQQGGSEYRRLIQMGQASPPLPPLVTGIACPKCNLANPPDLVYCDDEKCATVLVPGDRFCSQCGVQIPLKGSYCPECGYHLA